MTDAPTPTPDQQPEPPTADHHRRDRTRPLELLGFSGVLAVFIGLFVFLGTRELWTSLIFAGVAFILILVVLAMLLLASGPKELPTQRDGAGDRDSTPPPPH